MPAFNEESIEARVTRYNVARFRAGQALVPIAIIVTIFARRLPDVVPISAALVAQGLAVLAFLSAIRWLGWQPVRVERSAVWLGSTGVQAPRNRVRDWTYVNGVARLYGADTSFTLRARKGQEAMLEALLRGLLGKPTQLERRGSKRGRIIAISAAVVGLVLVGLAFALDSIPLIVVGMPAFIFGLATFGALSQRVARS
jgi:hypothetical protein